ncbi:MAG: chaperone, ATP12 [Rhodospirillales bacterium]|nr:chaperone, ATP12 [Rhodospirillales bacterium]MBN8926366.1 chaperone, ATP12 [Rhodospirillales bacterium]
MKRFWEEVTIERDEAGHAILLDGRPMHLPNGGEVLRIGPAPLAEAVAAEWRAAGGAKGGEMSFGDTPLTRLAGTAQARIAPDPAPTADAIARYCETDLLCYRAEHPPELTARQAREWQPWLDWAALTYDAPLRVTAGIAHVRQHRDSIAALRRVVGGLDVHALAGLGIAVPALGSLVLGLALLEGRIDAEGAHRLGALDELFQEEQWGADYEAVHRRAGIAADVTLAARYMALTRPHPAGGTGGGTT